MAHKKPEGKKRGKQISISPEAHRALIEQSLTRSPRKTLRQLINKMLNIPENL